MIKYIVLTGLQLLTLIGTVSEWRTKYFREYPYLYASEGKPNYEHEYTKTYLASAKSSLAAAYRKRKLVGFLTGIPLTDDVDFADVAELFKEAHLNPNEYYYFGEIIVDPAHQREGIASHLFKQLEQKAQKLGYKKFCFVTIEHPDNHPLKPAGYKNHTLWERLEYKETDITFNAVYPTLQSDGSYRDDENILRFWIKDASNKN